MGAVRLLCHFHRDTGMMQGAASARRTTKDRTWATSFSRLVRLAALAASLLSVFHVMCNFISGIEPMCVCTRGNMRSA